MPPYFLVEIIAQLESARDLKITGGDLKREDVTILSLLMSGNIMESEKKNRVSINSKSYRESQLAFWVGVHQEMLESVVKLGTLNSGVVKDALQESAATTAKMMAAGNLQEMFLISAERGQRQVDSAGAYSYQLSVIVRNLCMEIVRLAQANIVDVNQKACNHFESIKCITVGRSKT